MTGKYLITTDNWFIAPDGKSYRAVWGEVKHTSTANRKHIPINGTVRIGSDDHHMILSGCQIHYAISCPERPHTGRVEQTFDGKEQVNGSPIYIPEPEKKNTGSEILLFGPDGGDVEQAFKFLEGLKRMKNESFLEDAEDHYREIMQKAVRVGIKNYHAYPKLTDGGNSILEIRWGDGSETREIF